MWTKHEIYSNTTETIYIFKTKTWGSASNAGIIYSVFYRISLTAFRSTLLTWYTCPPQGGHHTHPYSSTLHVYTWTYIYINIHILPTTAQKTVTRMNRAPYGTSKTNARKPPFGFLHKNPSPNNGRNYQFLKWWSPDFRTINSITVITKNRWLTVPTYWFIVGPFTNLPFVSVPSIYVVLVLVGHNFAGRTPRRFLKEPSNDRDRLRDRSLRGTCSDGEPGNRRWIDLSKEIPTDPRNIPQTLNHLFMKEILS